MSFFSSWSITTAPKSKKSSIFALNRESRSCHLAKYSLRPERKPQLISEDFSQRWRNAAPDRK
jgi:hypothetical protein